MGADAFIVFYGLRYILTDGELEAVEARVDSRVVAARLAKVATYFGRSTDGKPYVLLIGARLGKFGVEDEAERSMDAAEVEQVMRDTNSKLRDAGLAGPPQFHFQLFAQY